MRTTRLAFGLVVVSLSSLLFCFTLLFVSSRYDKTSSRYSKVTQSNTTIEPVSTVKPGGYWIVLNSDKGLIKNVKRFASFKSWNLVVVADSETSSTLSDVHFLSIDYQKIIGGGKMSGYLYAISQGAEWIYTTDDENPYQFALGLDPFFYEDFVSGVRHSITENRTFNPIDTGNGTQVLCEKMERAAVQYEFHHHNPFAPPITLSVGTYASWNTRNTLLHKFAFHTLFLGSQSTLHSIVAQKVLHLSGLTVSLVPSKRHHKKNTDSEEDEDHGELIEYLNNWNCSVESVKECVSQLTEELVEDCLWGREDADATEQFMNRLAHLGFQFPSLVDPSTEDQYRASNKETIREVNCRRMSLQFELIDRDTSVQKLNYFGDIADWCNASGYSKLSKYIQSPQKLANLHQNNTAFQNERDTVLVAVNNFPWKYAMGLIQRLYQPYFATVIFCGSWYPDQITDADNFTSIISPFNYVHMNPAEMINGYNVYHCMTLVRDMQLRNVKGYFLLADDSFFNIWHSIDYDLVHHVIGYDKSNTTNEWWDSNYGMNAALRILDEVKKENDDEVQKTWKEYGRRLTVRGRLKSNETAEMHLTAGIGKSFSDFYYIPAHEIDYYASLMRLFYRHKVFLEIALHLYLETVDYTQPIITDKSYLWGDDRHKKYQLYDKNMIALHPVKPSGLKEPSEERKQYCATFMQTWADFVFGGSKNFKN